MRYAIATLTAILLLGAGNTIASESLLLTSKSSRISFDINATEFSVAISGNRVIWEIRANNPLNVNLLDLDRETRTTAQAVLREQLTESPVDFDQDPHVLLTIQFSW